MRSWFVEQDGTLKNFTDEHDPQASFFFSQLLKKRDIKINGKRVSADVPVFSGDEITYYLTQAQEEKSAFFTVYEDSELLVIDKESGVNAEAVFAMLCREKSARGESLYFIHRLDRNTQGLMLFAKTPSAEEETKRAFKDRSFEKIYRAICRDGFRKDHAIEEAYLQKDAARSSVKIFDESKKGTEKIVTEYRVIARRDALVLAEITLHTGKTHQIRAHLAHLHCPVLGDTKYGDKALNARYLKTRQRLVARRLTLHFSPDSPLFYADGKTFVSRYELSLDEP